MLQLENINNNCLVDIDQASDDNKTKKMRLSTAKKKQLVLLNLTRNVTQTHLEEIFGTFGRLKSVHLPTNKYNPFIHDGYAIIEYEKVKYCKMAMRYMNGGQIDGQIIQVEPCDNEECVRDNIPKPKQNIDNVNGDTLLSKNSHIVNFNSSHSDKNDTLDTVNSHKGEMCARDDQKPNEKSIAIEHDDISSCHSSDSPDQTNSFSKTHIENKCQIRSPDSAKNVTSSLQCSKIGARSNPTPSYTEENERNEIEHDVEKRESKSNIEIDKDRLYQIAKDNLRRLMYFGEIQEGTEMYRLAEIHIQRWDKEDKIARRPPRLGRRHSDSEDELLLDNARRKCLKKSQPIEINVRGGHRSESPEDLRFLYPVSKGYRPIMNPDIPWVEVDPHTTGKKKKSKLKIDEKKTDDETDEALLSENEKISRDQEIVRPGLGLDVGVLHSLKLNSVKKLKEDPGNVVALQQLQSTTKLIEMFENTRTPITKLNDSDSELKHLVFPDGEGLGHHLLKKMGWTPGTGLGRHQQGIIEPLAPKSQLDTKGLVTEDEKARSITRQLVQSNPNVVTSSSRTPVSILNEHCWKSKRLIPKYDIVHEDGPAHKKNFQYSVIIDGVVYQSTMSCGNKKEAKQVAAAVAAEALGLLLN